MASACAVEALDELGLQLRYLILKGKRGWHLLRQCRDPWADPRAERLRSEPAEGRAQWAPGVSSTVAGLHL